MLRNELREYFSFTKKERVGIFVLIGLIIIVFIAPYFFSSPASKIDPGKLAQFQNEITQLKSLHADDSSFERKEDHEENHNSHHALDYSTHQEEKSSLFYFDPNTTSPEQWKRLGIGDRTIHTIQNYLTKGGKFRAAEDLNKIYGMRHKDYERLFPFVHIKNISSHEPENHNDSNRRNISFVKKENNLRIIDINHADSVQLMSLPGIGSRLASRIIRFRERLGGFYAVGQLGEVYGLTDSVIKSIQPWLTLGKDSLHQVDINTANVGTLKQHPYIRWEIAKAIIQYRDQHGPFKKPEDLLQIDLITGEAFSKVSPYIRIRQ